MTDEQNRGLDGKKEKAMAGGKRMVVNQQNGLTLLEISIRWMVRTVVPSLILQNQDSIYSNLRTSPHLGRDKLNPVVWSVRIQAMHVGCLCLLLTHKWSSESPAPKLGWQNVLKEYQFWCVRFEWFKRPSIRRPERGRRESGKRPWVWRKWSSRIFLGNVQLLAVERFLLQHFLIFRNSSHRNGEMALHWLLNTVARALLPCSCDRACWAGEHWATVCKGNGKQRWTLWPHQVFSIPCTTVLTSQHSPSVRSQDLFSFFCWHGLTSLE